MLSYYRFHLLKISFSQVELLILRDYSLKFISRIKYLLLDPTIQKVLFSSSLMRMKVGGPDSLVPVCCHRERHIFPGPLQGKLVTKVSQETSSPKRVPSPYGGVWGRGQYSGNCPSVNYLSTLNTFFQKK